MTSVVPLRFDAAGLVGVPGGIEQAELESLNGRMSAIREEILNDDLALFAGKGTIPPEKEPLDAGFIELPERLLDAYQTDRKSSELFRLLKTAKLLQGRVDRVVVLGIGGSYMGARAIIETCCDPYINELPAGERGGRPKLFFAGFNVDNDSTRGLLHMLRTTNKPNDPLSRWAIVVVSKSGGTLETAVALRQFIKAWVDSFGPEQLDTA